MSINPISNFGYNQVSFRGLAMCYDSKVDGKKSIEDEIQILTTIKRKTKDEVDTPIIKGLKTQEDRISVQFITQGFPADAKENPIKEEHLPNLFKNFLSLEKLGILHGDLSLKHLFFSKNGKVELDCFRTSSAFALQDGKFNFVGKKQDTVMPFELPSNAKNFEEFGLPQYLRTLKTREEKFDFMKKYLMAKSDYHAKRAELIYSEEGKTEESARLGIESFRKELFKDPPDSVVNFELYKADTMIFEALKAIDKKWAEGCGKYTGKPKPEAKLDCMILMFECLKCADNIMLEAETLAKSNKSPHEKMYFELEQETAAVLRQKICTKFNKMKEEQQA